MIWVIAITNVWTGTLSWWNNIFLLTNATSFYWFHELNALISLYITHRWLFSLFEDNQWKLFHAHTQENWRHYLDNRWNYLHRLWSRFTSFKPLLGLFFHLRYEVMDLCFVRGYESMQKIVFIGVKHSIETASVFVPLWTHATPILRTAFSCPNFQLICDVQHFLKCSHIWWLVHFQLTVILYHFVNFLHHLWCGYLIWSTTAVFILADRT